MSDMSNEQSLAVLYGLTEEQLKSIQEQISKFDEQNKALVKANRELSNTIVTIEQEAKASVKTMIQAEVSTLTKGAKEGIKEAIAEALQEATETTKKVNKSLSLFGLRWFMLWAFGVITGMAFFFGAYKFYDNKITELARLEIQFEESIKNLKLLNKGNVIIEKCEEIACVKVNEKDRFTDSKGNVFYGIKQ